jgi:hypothetical protein
MFRRPSHATLVAYLALFAALATGTAFAATQLGRDSVKSRHIDNGAVRGSDVKAGAVGLKQLAETPNGLMIRSKPAIYVKDGFIEYERLSFGEPADAFDARKGTFVAPADGTYMVVSTIDWKGIAPRTASVLKGFDFKKPLLRSNFVGEGDQTVAGLVRLEEGDKIVVYVDAAGGSVGESRGASLTVSYVSG